MGNDDSVAALGQAYRAARDCLEGYRVYCEGVLMIRARPTWTFPDALASNSDRALAKIRDDAAVRKCIPQAVWEELVVVSGGRYKLFHVHGTCAIDACLRVGEKFVTRVDYHRPSMAAEAEGFDDPEATFLAMVKTAADATQTTELNAFDAEYEAAKRDLESEYLKASRALRPNCEHLENGPGAPPKCRRRKRNADQEEKRAAKRQRESADRRLWDAWESKAYRTYEELAREKKIDVREVRRALDRQRKQLERAGKRPADKRGK